MCLWQIYLTLSIDYNHQLSISESGSHILSDILQPIRTGYRIYLAVKFQYGCYRLNHAFSFCEQFCILCTFNEFFQTRTRENIGIELRGYCNVFFGQNGGGPLPLDKDSASTEEKVEQERPKVVKEADSEDLSGLQEQCVFVTCEATL